jgi:hypothetical protein
MPQYALARHVFVCMQGEHVVFLDVRKDRYFALESARTAGLGEFVPGWPVPILLTQEHAQCVGAPSARVAAESFDRGTLSAVISLLLEKEILTSAVNGKAVTLAESAPLRGEISGESLDDSPRIGVVRLPRFVAASIRARLLLKYRTFESVIARVSERIQRSAPEEATLDEARIHELIAAFATVRPFFFAAKDACLFDALALSEFLAGYRVFPRWVFGVQARPFAAHCWLQLGGLVLNDTVDHVRRYTPIMVV